MPSGPRRAQAKSQLADRIGPMPDNAHAVTSRVTSWAFWFAQFVRVNGQHVYCQSDDDTIEFYRTPGFRTRPTGMEKLIGKCFERRAFDREDS
jgi:hypothetical protein